MRVAVFFVILALNTPLATAADDLPLMKLNLLQTRKRCKRPSAKRAPGRHPGLFQISQLFRTRFPADFSPGQEEQPMFWLKDKFLYQITVSIHATSLRPWGVGSAGSTQAT